MQRPGKEKHSERPAATGPKPSGVIHARGRVEFPIVGIGASAGGLEAFKRFFSTLPADSGMAFVLIQHLAPTEESLMVDLLTRCTAMKVSQVKDQMSIEANHVFIIPPNKYLAISSGELQLTDPIVRHGIRMPIDFFFRSLAEDQQEKAICIILSGTGTDGTLGLQAIKSHDGMAMAQVPETAQYDGMPRSAISTGLVDYVLPAEKMPEALVRYVHSYINRAAVTEPLAAKAPDYLHAILAVLRARTKYDFRCYKKGTLMRRIERRMSLNHLEQLADYAQFLRENPTEALQLFKDFLIGVTGFFREPEPFQILEHQVIPRLVAGRETDETLRVWVPGCATGEEAYSIAMLFIEQLQAAQKSRSTQIFASDIDKEALEIARTGVYPENIGADVSSERLHRFFTKQGETYQVSEQVRGCVVFALQNLISDPPFSKLDLISCRNLLIYLEPEVQKKVIALFHFALRPGGYLFLGTSESIGQQEDLFEPVSKKWRIYRRIGPTQPGRVDFPIGSSWGKPPGAEYTPESIALPRITLGELTQGLLLEEYAPASVLINRKYEILYFYGPTNRYLDLPKGEAKLDLIAMAQEGLLRTKLRAAMHKAIRDDERITVTGLGVQWGGTSHSTRISVRPIKTPRVAEGLLLVTFEDEPTLTSTRGTGTEAMGPEEPLVRQLEYELQLTKEDLQSTIQEMETSNEELKASNEEVMSMNEELQSANEELETSKEELQSLNEELSTVNNELREKVAELEATNNDLANLLGSADIATVFLDTQFRIKRFTQASTQLFKLIATDVGRPLSDISHNFSVSDLLDAAGAVLRELTPREQEVCTTDERWYIRRILPYRTQDNKIDGIVLTFNDVTELKQTVAELKTLNETLEQRVTARTHSIELLQHVAVVANQATSVEEAFKATLEWVCRHLKWPVGHVYRPAADEKGPFVDTGFWRLSPPKERFKSLVEVSQQSAFSPGEGIVGTIIASGQPHWVTDLAQYAGEARAQRTPDLGVRAAFAFPVLVGEQVVAVLEFFTPEAAEPDKELFSVVAQIGTQLGRVVERTRAEQILREREARIRSIMETAAEGIITIDEHGIVDSFNPAAERIFGYPAQEMVGQSVNQLMPSPYREAHDSYIERYLSTGETKIIGRGREIVGQRKDGSILPLDLAISEFRQGTRRMFAGLMRDITERKAAEQALRESEEHYRSLFEGSIQGIYSHRNWRPLMVNQAYAEMLGYESPDEILALESLEPHIAPYDRPHLHRYLKALSAGEKMPPYEYDAVRKDGSTVTLQSIMRLITWNSEPAVQSTAIDITPQKRAEEEARRHQAELNRVARLTTVGEMGTILAHELNQPLTAIVNYSEGATRRLRSAKNAVSPELVDALDQVVTMAKRAATIVRDLRNFISQGNIERQTLNLNEVIGQAVQLVAAEARNKGMTLKTELTSEMPLIAGDFIQLEQLVLNLILNGMEAIEATGMRQGELTLRTVTAGNHQVELSVQDTGIGLSPEVEARLFEAFVTTKPDGLGMGLSIGRTIVEAHGGRIWATSNPDRGTTFHVAFPMASHEHPGDP